MKLIDKVGAGISASIDLVVEKNRQLAQLNRLEAIIKNESEVISHAYAALGRQYFKILEGTAEEADMSQICEVIRFSETRLKKAQARYDYIRIYGVPQPQVSAVDMERGVQEAAAPAAETAPPAQAEEEGADITIAVAEEAEAPEDGADTPEAVEQGFSELEVGLDPPAGDDRPAEGRRSSRRKKK